MPGPRLMWGWLLKLLAGPGRLGRWARRHRNAADQEGETPGYQLVQRHGAPQQDQHAPDADRPLRRRAGRRDTSHHGREHDDDALGNGELAG